VKEDSKLHEAFLNLTVFLFNIVMIGLAKELPEQGKETSLHRLLGALLSATLAAEKKLDIIKTEYNIPIESKLREDVDTMCNLSQGIWETAEAAGKADMILAMRKAGYSYEEIARISGMTKEQIRQIEEDSMVNI
jgi:hypothetical protein